MVLVEGDRERRVGWQDQLCVSLSPVPVMSICQVSRNVMTDEYELDASDVYGCRACCLVDRHDEER